MQTIKTYSVTHKMPRTRAVDADAIAQRVNDVTAGSGDSLYRGRVQEELDSLCDSEKQAFYGFEIVETENEIEED